MALAADVEMFERGRPMLSREIHCLHNDILLRNPFFVFLCEFSADLRYGWIILSRKLEHRKLKAGNFTRQDWFDFVGGQRISLDLADSRSINVGPLRRATVTYGECFAMAVKQAEGLVLYVILQTFAFGIFKKARTPSASSTVNSD